MIDKKIIGWFSCGITSAVACKMVVDKYGKDNVILVYFVIDSAHEDNERFIQQCEEWIGVKVERWRSPKYLDQFDVIKKTRYVNGPGGARCTKELKNAEINSDLVWIFGVSCVILLGVILQYVL